MSNLYFAGTSVTDREERIEEDMLFEALRQEMPEIEHSLDVRSIPDGAFILGRVPLSAALSGRYGYPRAEHLSCAYWKWPAFLARAQRSFRLCDFESACAEVARLQNEGQGAFVKAIDDKLLAIVIPDGQTLQDRLGDMAYSFIDRPPCLMVQARVEIEFEFRILVVDGVAVTGAGQVPQHTPLDNQALFDPKLQRRIGKSPTKVRHDLVEKYLDFARETIPLLPQQSLTLDLAIINGEVGIVECNSMMPGRVGLFASDVKAFAAAVASSRALAACRQPGRSMS